MFDWSNIDYFKPDEFDYPEKMDAIFIVKLDLTRDIAGIPLFISSDYRPGDTRSHGMGLAVDITDDPYHDGISGQFRWRVVKAAQEAGITRVGLYDKHVHLDYWLAAPQNVIWIGQSE